MAWNRFRKMAKQRRQYTLTRTKAVLSFCLSVFFSMMLGPYFERYGGALIEDVKVSMLGKKRPLSTSTAVAPEPAPTRAEDAGLQERLRRLGKRTELFPKPKRPAKEIREKASKQRAPLPEQTGTF